MDILADHSVPPAAAVVFHSIQPHNANLDDNTQTPTRKCLHVNGSGRRCRNKAKANSDVCAVRSHWVSSAIPVPPVLPVPTAAGLSSVGIGADAGIIPRGKDPSAKIIPKLGIDSQEQMLV